MSGSSSPASACPSCGRDLLDGDVFCSQCGTSVKASFPEVGPSRREVARKTLATGERQNCASCHSLVLPGDAFCSTCGARCDVDPGAEAFSGTWTEIPTRVTEASGGKYDLIRELGRGGMGIVFMARDRELERLVAIKVLSPSLLADEGMVKRFQREARTIASLRHESIVSIYDVGRTGDLHYFVMDFIEGVSLSRVLRTHGPLPIDVVKAVLYQVGSALAYAHRRGRGIVHRDVKPSNIMLDAEGLAVVMDFGISKVSDSASGLTRTGLVIGTPEYMSPEQCRGHTVTEDSDQYSLGAVVYAMLTGAPPFTGPFYRVLMAHQTEPLPDLRELRPDCPPELAEATARMLRKTPGERWPGIQDALASLGLRPLAHDDPALLRLGDLVRSTVAATGGSGEGRGSTGGAGPRTPTSIRIVPVPDDLEIGDELALRAAALFDDGVEETGLEVAWESTDPSIVRVDPDTGELEAVGVGSAEVRAVGAGLTQSVPVEVRPPRVVRVDIQPGDVEVEVGSAIRLRAEPLSKRERSLPRSVSWSSSDPRTATVSQDGVVTGRAEGSAHILAHSEGVGAATVVRVVAATTATTSPGVEAGPVTRIDVSQPPRGVEVGNTFHLKATPRDREGRAVERPVRWTVEDPSILEGLGEGEFRAYAPGRGTILVEADEARTRVHVTVEPGGPAAKGVAGKGGASEEAREARAPAGIAGTEKEGRRGVPVGAGSKPVSPGRRPPWVAVGAVGALLLGAALVWAVAGGGGPDEPVPAAELAILAGSSPLSGAVEMAVGDTLALTAAVTGEAGAEDPVSWSSSDPSVASVDPAGIVRALAAGGARITARSGEATREVDLTVTGPAPSSVRIAARGSGEPMVGTVTLDVGESLALGGQVRDADGAVLAGSPVEWIASPTAVVTVSPDGTVQARAPGTGQVTVRSGELQAQLPIRVRASEPTPATASAATPERDPEPVRPAPAAAERRPPPSEPEPEPAQPGTLLVRIVPTWAYLVVDGERRGQGSQTHELSLPAGEHRLRLENPNMTPLDTTFTIRPGATTELRLRLRPRSP